MFISQAIYIPRNMEAGTLGHGRLIYVKPFGIGYAVLLQPRSTLQLSNVPESPGIRSIFLLDRHRFFGLCFPIRIYIHRGPIEVAPGSVRLFWWDARSYTSVP